MAKRFSDYEDDANDRRGRGGHRGRPPRGGDRDSFGGAYPAGAGQPYAGGHGPQAALGRGFGGGSAGGFQGASSQGHTATVKVKWYNADKGFGFVEVVGAGGDAFLHASVLPMGAGAPQPGTTMTVDVGAGQKGQQVLRVHDVDDSTAEAPRAPRASRADAAAAPAVEHRGCVKWYDAQRGFGFAAVDGGAGSKDVFVHASALRRSGLPDCLAEGQRVVMQVVQGAKGPEARSVRLD